MDSAVPNFVVPVLLVYDKRLSQVLLTPTANLEVLTSNQINNHYSSSLSKI